jgi:hypothetical protein
LPSARFCQLSCPRDAAPYGDLLSRIFHPPIETPTARRIRARVLRARTHAAGRVPSRGVPRCAVCGLGFQSGDGFRGRGWRAPGQVFEIVLMASEAGGTMPARDMIRIRPEGLFCQCGKHRDDESKQCQHRRASWRSLAPIGFARCVVIPCRRNRGKRASVWCGCRIATRKLCFSAGRGPASLLPDSLCALGIASKWFYAVP